MVTQKPLSPQMTPKETKAYIRDLKKFVSQISSSPKQKSRSLLESAGVTTKKGNLRKPYR